MYGQEFPNLTGGTAVMLPNHHLAKPVLIGEIQADGQFDIISQTAEVPGDAWTDFLPESRGSDLGLEGPRLRHVQHRDQDLRADAVELLSPNTQRRAGPAAVRPPWVKVRHMHTHVFWPACLCSCCAAASAPQAQDGPMQDDPAGAIRR